jgi:hypothetical protein
MHFNRGAYAPPSAHPFLHIYNVKELSSTDRNRLPDLIVFVR